MAAAYHNRPPESMAMIILMCTVAALLSTSAAHVDLGSVENCVESLYNPPSGPEFYMKLMMCRDLLRSIGITFRTTGKLPPEYEEALQKLPKFRDDPAALKKFICSLSPTETARKIYGCEKDGGSKN